MKCVILLTLLIVAAFGFDFKPDVVVLNNNNFDQLVKRDLDQNWIIMFYADWCGHCQSLKPEFEIAAANMKKFGVKLGAVSEGDARELVGEYAANPQTHMISYPTVIVFQGGQKHAHIPHTIRTASALQAWYVNEYKATQDTTQEIEGEIEIEGDGEVELQVEL